MPPNIAKDIIYIYCINRAGEYSKIASRMHGSSKVSLLRLLQDVLQYVVSAVTELLEQRTQINEVFTMSKR